MFKNPSFFNIVSPCFPGSGKMHKSKDVAHLWRKMGRLTLPPQASPNDSEMLQRICCWARLKVEFTFMHLAREELILISWSKHIFKMEMQNLVVVYQVHLICESRRSSLATTKSGLCRPHAWVLPFAVIPSPIPPPCPAYGPWKPSLEAAFHSHQDRDGKTLCSCLLLVAGALWTQPWNWLEIEKIEVHE